MSQDPERSGILLVDKPGGLTSHDVVSRVRRLAATRKVGHAGTLDPMATGLLILGVGSSTRLLTFLVGLDKEYLATIRLGASTPTDDAESTADRVAPAAAIAAIADEDLVGGIATLSGTIQQVPSAVSAIKVDGKRAYARVRAGEQVELKAREVLISEFALLETRRGEFLDLDVRVACSSGTYIRALARDLGSALGVGGHLVALRRTRIGPFDLSRAATLGDLDAPPHLLDPAVVASTLFPSLVLSAQQATDLAHGKRLAGLAIDGGPVAAITEDGRLAGLVEVVGGTARPIVNFPKDEVS